uniref:Acetylserotonin O-methyltransferase n=1 Tax=Sinocyclocheilus grahami TaxID=75366 RepID=A0A672N278_SINGR
MPEHLSQSELDYPFKLLEYFNGFRISKVCSLLLSCYQNECMNINQSIDINQYFCATSYVMWNHLRYLIIVEKCFSTKCARSSRFASYVILRCFAGCSGALARELAKEYPSSTVTVLDLPAVVQTAQQHFAQQDATIWDFFEGEIPPADLYILARIIHDWKEEKNLKLLKKIHTACHPGGGVLIAEALLFENRRGPTMVQMFSLNMLVQTEGKEHPPSHYTHMLTEAGFRDVQVCRTGKSYNAILALK